jgi:hypothetical protein
MSSTASVVCSVLKDGYGCDGKHKVYLVIYPDQTSEMLCQECIKLNKNSLDTDHAHVVEIGDDVTHHFF